MGVYIKGVEIPKENRLTLQISADGAVYVVNSCSITAETYTTDAVSVPSHGRLIDADALKADALDESGRMFISNIQIFNAPTIIPAEECET